MRSHNRRRTIAVVVLLLAGALVLFRLGRDRAPGGGGEGGPGASRDQDPAQILDRLWLDSKPERYTDFTHVMLVVSAVPIGLFQKSSAYQAQIELFEYKRKNDKIGLLFPQTGRKSEVRYRVRACDDLPPFDLCLELSENPWGGPRRYYGMIDPDQEHRELGWLRHELEHRIQDRREAALAR